MTKLEIIDEIVSYYSEDTFRRSICPDTGMCLYYLEEINIGDEPKVCAVGYCVKNPEWLENHFSSSISYLKGRDSYEILGIESVQDIFKEEYKGHNLKFWEDIQNLHDTKEYWSEKGLTTLGKLKLMEIKEEWKE